MKHYFNKENLVTFAIVLAAVVSAPMVLGWFRQAKAKVSGK